MFGTHSQRRFAYVPMVLLFLPLPSHVFYVHASTPLEASISSYLCNQQLQNMRTQKFIGWPGLPIDARLELPTCAPNGAATVWWFEGHEPMRRRRLPLADAGSLFDGCIDYRRLWWRDHKLRLNLRPDRCRQLKNLSLSLTCVPSVAGPSEVHVLQLTSDLRCLPGTRRDRLGLCRQCGDNSGGDLCCWQPFWEAAECPLSCKEHSSFDVSISSDDNGALVDVEDFKTPVVEFPRLVRRERRAASIYGNSSYALTGKVMVKQLACPNRIWVVATVICLLEMHYPTRGELVSLVVAAFTTVAFLSMPIFIGYAMGQIYWAGFLPFLQFHLYERSALLSSSMRTQALFAPSLWDFTAFRMAEKRRRLAHEELTSLLDGFRRREFQNLLLWEGVQN